MGGRVVRLVKKVRRFQEGVGRTREKTRRCKTCSTTQEMMTKMDRNDTHEHINVRSRGMHEIVVWIQR